jgi:hypothetical protein
MLYFSLEGTLSHCLSEIRMGYSSLYVSVGEAIIATERLMTTESGADDGL